MKITYNKLVRDRIPEIISAAGNEFAIETIPEQEHLDSLFDKLKEEVSELLEADDQDRAKELADIYEILDWLIKHFELSPQEVKELQDERRQERGGFRDRIRLLWVDDL